jgi:predicted glutamine amidotransferase
MQNHLKLMDFLNSNKLAGFGIGWYNFALERWKYVKSSKSHADVSNMDKLIMYAGISPLVVGVCGAQPYIVDGQMFMHSGYLENFTMVGRSLMKKISPTYRPMITGETDSEWLFYFILSMKEYLETKKWGKLAKEMEIQIQTIKMCIHQLKRYFKNMCINTIYVNAKFSVITNYSYGISSAPLYLNGGETGKLLITSEPIMKKFSLIPPNMIIYVNHQTNEYVMSPI